MRARAYLSVSVSVPVYLPVRVSVHMLIFSFSPFPPPNSTQRYITIGLHRDALVLYERLELWEGVIAAHQLLNQDKTAERIVRARIDVEPDK